jgi:sigma-E factor negative regulatory protein RseC
MQTINCIIQEGTVEEISNGLLKVNIISKSLCSACHAKDSCTSMDIAQKQFTFQTYDPSLLPGDKVLLKMHRSKGPLAVYLAYVLPFIIFFIVLLIFNSLFHNDLYSGLGSLGSIIIYYLIIKLFTKQLQTIFIFQVEKAGI